MAEGLFDLTAVCGEDQPTTLPVHTISSMLDGDLSSWTVEELLPALCRQGRISCFASNATWENDPARDVEKLCRALRRELAAARAEHGELFRCFVSFGVSPDVGMEIFERCTSILTREGVPPEGIFLQVKFMDPPVNRVIRVRGMVG